LRNDTPGVLLLLNVIADSGREPRVLASLHRPPRRNTGHFDKDVPVFYVRQILVKRDDPHLCPVIDIGRPGTFDLDGPFSVMLLGWGWVRSVLPFQCGVWLLGQLSRGMSRCQRALGRDAYVCWPIPAKPAASKSTGSTQTLMSFSRDRGFSTGSRLI
jgi:hypothetical protein